jgi:MscS family membrane protein
MATEGCFSIVVLPVAQVAQAGSQLPQVVQRQLPGGWKWLTELTVAGNEAWRVIALFVAILLALIAGRVLRFFLNAAAARFQARGRNLVAATLCALARSAVFVLLVIGLTAGLEFLSLHPTVAAISSVITSILATTAIGYMAYCLAGVIDQWLRDVSEKTPSKLDDMLVPLVRKSLRATIVILVLVQIATILSDKPVTSIIAGLGVGGLAVGLAAQDTIKNVFGSMMIFSDRPFEMGDQITVDGHEGFVEVVGFRSTRFRTLDGHLVTIPNGELANKTIVNISKRGNLVRRLNLALAYDLPPEKIQRALEIVKEILTDHEGLSPRLPPRIFFNDFTPTALNLLIIYWYHPPDWVKFSAFNERFNLEIVRRFRHDDISLAYPTQTVRLLSDSPPEGR